MIELCNGGARYGMTTEEVSSRDFNGGDGGGSTAEEGGGIELSSVLSRDHTYQSREEGSDLGGYSKAWQGSMEASPLTGEEWRCLSRAKV